MALHLNVSNSLTQLSKKLCDDLKSQENGVFQPYYILTQTEGMNNWLKLQIAGNLGIAANYQFLKPTELIHQVYFLLGGKFSETLSSENLSWLLYRLLNESDFTTKFKTVASYYTDKSTQKEVKRMALAEKLADIFDQYQIYRPEMIEQWNAGSLDETDDWQKFLWIKAGQLAGNVLPDKTLMSKYILEALKDPQKRQYLMARMPAIHVFGLSITTSYHLRIFYEIAKYINLSFYILNPAPSVYWFEDRSEKYLSVLKKKGLLDMSEPSLGNSLLTSWGKLVQDTFSLLFENEDLINNYHEVAIEAPVGAHLLHTIQQDIFYNNNQEERIPVDEANLKDGSITVNSCYTMAREVEVLYNYLVYLIDKKQVDLSPRDIVVMVSDIDGYAPYIKAVFNNAPYKFKFTIADESYTAADSLSSALQAILLINEQNFKAEEVLQLLDSAYILKRFGLSDLPLIRKVVSQANIRFGMTGDLVDDTIYVSWEYGIQRIIYGICMSGEEEYGSGETSFFPLDIIEGNASLELIRFCHFVQVLMESINERKKERRILDWVEYVENVLHHLICDPEETTDEDYVLLLKQLENYNKLNELMTEEISYEVFIHNFLKRISNATRSGSFAAGGITFCSLIPMRSIPFKVVALLGLNFDKFPRKEIPVSFNLLEIKKRKGDRNIKENDKHLFLETILSAQEYLYISYIGRSVKDNSSIPPSALVDELLDYIEAGSKLPHLVRQQLVTHHPLHGFSKKYKESNDRFYDYLNNQFFADNNRIDTTKEAEPFDFEQVSLPALISFLQNPFKGFYNHVLGIYYRNDVVLLDNYELFELDNLQKWQLKNELLLHEAGGLLPLKDKLVKTGSLPLKNMAEVSLQHAEKEVLVVRELYRECVGDSTEQNFTVNLPIDGSIISGNLKGIYDNKLLVISWSKNECKHLLAAYIRYLAARASGLSLQLHFISANKERIYKGKELDIMEAHKRLEVLLRLYKQGHENLLTFYADFEIKPAHVADLDSTKFQKIVNNKLNSFNAPCTEMHIVSEYKKGHFFKEGVFEQYLDNARKLLVPLGDFFEDYYAK